MSKPFDFSKLIDMLRSLLDPTAVDQPRVVELGTGGKEH
jgi:hypothetical protein